MTHEPPAIDILSIVLGTITMPFFSVPEAGPGDQVPERLENSVLTIPRGPPRIGPTYRHFPKMLLKMLMLRV